MVISISVVSAGLVSRKKKTTIFKVGLNKISFSYFTPYPKPAFEQSEGTVQTTSFLSLPKASAKWRLGILWEGKIYFLIFPSKKVSFCQIVI